MTMYNSLVELLCEKYYGQVETEMDSEWEVKDGIGVGWVA